MYAVNFDLGFAIAHPYPVASCAVVLGDLPSPPSAFKLPPSGDHVTELDQAVWLTHPWPQRRSEPDPQPSQAQCVYRSLGIFLKEGWLEILEDVAPEKCGQCFRWQWRKNLKIGPLPKTRAPQIERPYRGHAMWALSSAPPAPDSLYHEPIQPFRFIGLGCYVCRYDLKSEFLTLDEMWPCRHWQEPHRGKVCEVFALRHPRHISDLLVACNEAGNEIPI